MIQSWRGDVHDGSGRSRAPLWLGLHQNKGRRRRVKGQVAYMIIGQSDSCSAVGYDSLWRAG